jgi:hypothetical protein
MNYEESSLLGFGTVYVVLTDVSEARIASIFRVEEKIQEICKRRDRENR